MTTPPPSIWTLKANGRKQTFTLSCNDTPVKSSKSSAALVAIACRDGGPLDLVEIAGELVALAEFRYSHVQATRLRAAQAEAHTKVTAIRAALPAECKQRPAVEVGRVVEWLEMEGVKTSK